MWPLLLDMTKEESLRTLRALELEAFRNLVDALRAQGTLNSDKQKLMKEMATILNISQERHTVEIRRAVNDEKLGTIAYYMSGHIVSDEWMEEGRRLIPLIPRIAPQTAFSVIADEVADSENIKNEQLPLPSNTERKRIQMLAQNQCIETGKLNQFREISKTDESKKRKLSLNVENSNLAHHLLGPAKVSRIQQIYRQKTKAKQLSKMKREDPLPPKPQLIHLTPKTKLPLSPQSTPSVSPKVNILQNMSIFPKEEETIEQIKNEINNFQKLNDKNCMSPQPSCSNENQAPKNKVSKSNILFKHITNISDSQKTLKLCPPRKTIIKNPQAGQKLIIVSNAQSIATSSILHRTLTVPFVKSISVKNLDKYKIVGTSNANIQLPTTTTPANKHKIVTVRTNPSTKKMIPLAHLQALNAKGSIKMLPLGSKIIKTTNAASSPFYIMNTTNAVQALTKSTTSTPIIMSCKPYEATTNDKSILYLKSGNITISSNNQDTVTPQIKEKSSVLTDILKASGVLVDTDKFSDDIESHITQLTAIPQTLPDNIIDDGSAEKTSIEVPTECLANNLDNICDSENCDVEPDSLDENELNYVVSFHNNDIADINGLSN